MRPTTAQSWYSIQIGGLSLAANCRFATIQPELTSRTMRSMLVHSRARWWRSRTVVAVIVVTLLGWSSVASAAPRSSSFSGPTDQQQGGVTFRISMDVSAIEISNVSLDALTLKGPEICKLTLGSTGFDFAKGTAPIDGGQVSGTLSDGHGDTVTIAGHVTAKTVMGSFVVKATGGVEGSTICNSGTVTFDASAPVTPSPNAHYSGTSGAGYPMSFVVSPESSEVEKLVVAFEETCNADGPNVAPKFSFKTIPITNDSFSGTVRTRDDTLSISGTFNGNTASGDVVDVSHVKSLKNCTESSTFVATAASQG
jgi:cytoskeletal protein CcmA (bactofilin family)